MKPDTRRNFLKKTTQAAFAVALPPFFLDLRQIGISLPVIGSGEHTYECVHDWLLPPDGLVWGDTHGLCQDCNGDIYVAHTVNKASMRGEAVVVLRPAGQVRARLRRGVPRGRARAQPAARGPGRESSIHCDINRCKVVKTTLAGDSSGSTATRARTPPTPRRRSTSSRRMSCSPPTGTSTSATDTAPATCSGFLRRGQLPRRDRPSRATATGEFDNPHGQWVDTRGPEPGPRRRRPRQPPAPDLHLEREAPAHREGRGAPSDALPLRRTRRLMVCPDLDSQVCLLDREYKVVAQLGDGQPRTGSWARAAANRVANSRRDSSSRRTLRSFCRAAISWWPNGCRSGASHACVVSDLARMNSRSRVILCAVGLFVVLLLLFAALQAPPDGVERSDLNQFIGRFHPLAVHLPIALVLLVALLECAGLFRIGKHLQAAAGFILVVATASALAAAFLGWMLGRSGGYEGALVTRHMWGGISLAAALVLCCAVRAWNSKLYGVALVATVCLMAWTSDQGGKLTHGEGFLTERMPASLRSLLGVPPEKKKRPAATSPTPSPTSVPTASGTVPPTPASVAFFTSRVEPIFDDRCVQCHGPEKKKGKLRLDTFDYVMQGGKDGAVVKPGDPKTSELFRRVTLPRDSKDAMPAEGKPGLTAAELQVIEFWIASGATERLTAEKVKVAAPPEPAKVIVPPLAPDYRSRSGEIAALQSKLGVHLVLRSQDPQDGIILRTASAPERCDDATLRALKPIADLIVDAELARTKVSDEGVKSLGSFANLRRLDLSSTGVTSHGLAPLMNLDKLESLNLTATAVDDDGVSPFRHKKGLQHLYLFGTKATPSEPSDTNAK